MGLEFPENIALTLERGQAWDETIAAIERKDGRDAREAIREVAMHLGLQKHLD